jgi:hypothetical protein
VGFVLLVFIILFIIKDKKEHTIDCELLRNLEYNTFIYLDSSFKVVRISSSLKGVIYNDKSRVNFIKMLNTNIRVMELNRQSATNNDIERTLILFRNSNDSELSLDFSFKDLNGEVKYLFLRAVRVTLKHSPHFILLGDLCSTNTNPNEFIDHTNDDTQITNILYLDFNNTDEYKYIIDYNSNSVFLSNKLKTLLNIPKQTILTSEFYLFFEKAELTMRNKVISALSASSSKYEVTYQLKINGNNQYFKESGILVEGMNPKLICYLQIVPMVHFEKSKIALLDELETKDDLVTLVTKLIKADDFFQILTFSPITIKDINNQYSREIGNFVLSEVIKHYQLILNTKIYRINGLLFGAVILDGHFINKLNNLRNENHYFTKEVINLGSNNYECFVKAGLSSYPYDAYKKTPFELINNSIKALKFTIESNVGYMEYRSLSEK